MKRNIERQQASFRLHTVIVKEILAKSGSIIEPMNLKSIEISGMTKFQEIFQRYIL